MGICKTILKASGTTDCKTVSIQMTPEKRREGGPKPVCARCAMHNGILKGDRPLLLDRRRLSEFSKVYDGAI